MAKTHSEKLKEKEDIGEGEEGWKGGDESCRGKKEKDESGGSVSPFVIQIQITRCHSLITKDGLIVKAKFITS